MKILNSNEVIDASHEVIDLNDECDEHILCKFFIQIDS